MTTKAATGIAVFGWLALTFGLGGCAGRTADSAGPVARPRDADAGAFDALAEDAQSADTAFADSPVEDALEGEAMTEDATGGDGDAAAAECTPGESRVCYNLIVPCATLETCRFASTWGVCPCFECEGQLLAGACSWSEEMADSNLVSERGGRLAVNRIDEDGGRARIAEVAAGSCTTDGGWYREVSGDGGTTTLTVALCPASCDERQAGSVQFVLEVGCAPSP
jgi:hypothetical protein